MRRTAALLVLLALVATACGGDDEPPAATSPSSVPTSATSTAATSASSVASSPTTRATSASTPAGRDVTVKLGQSQFGLVLFDGTGQAVYYFDPEKQGAPKCYDDCAVAWPPMLTTGGAKAGEGAQQSLVGTVKRRDGTTQVTYNGWPLYFYVNEGKNEVKCHNVLLNGGYWYALAPDGNRVS